MCLLNKTIYCLYFVYKFSTTSCCYPTVDALKVSVRIKKIRPIKAVFVLFSLPYEIKTEKITITYAITILFRFIVNNSPRYFSFNTALIHLYKPLMMKNMVKKCAGLFEKPFVSCKFSEAQKKMSMWLSKYLPIKSFFLRGRVYFEADEKKVQPRLYMLCSILYFAFYTFFIQRE